VTLRDTILGAADLPLHAVEVPEWGCTVYLRSLNVGERTRLLDVKDDEHELQLGAFIAGVRDSDGSPLFAPADREVLTAKSGAVVERLAKMVLHNAFPSVGALEKN
jgi:hypothetical protein